MKIAVLIVSTAMLLSPCNAQETVTFDKPILIEKSELPDVPRVLKKSNLTGIALVRVMVSEIGEIESVSMVRTTGLNALDAFLIDWIGEWSFLPKLADEETAAGFTIVSIRYNLATNSFESPPVNDLAMILPEAYSKIFASRHLKRKRQTPASTRADMVFPVRPLQVNPIPESLKNKGMIASLTIELVVDPSGVVKDVVRPDQLEDDELWQWVSSAMDRTEWPPVTGKSIRRIAVSLSIDTSQGLLTINDSLMKQVNDSM